MGFLIDWLRALQALKLVSPYEAGDESPKAPNEEQNTKITRAFDFLDVAKTGTLSQAAFREVR
jgi:hypothetical protein